MLIGVSVVHQISLINQNKMSKKESDLAKEIRELKEALIELEEAIELDNILFNSLFGK